MSGYNTYACGLRLASTSTTHKTRLSCRACCALMYIPCEGFELASLEYETWQRNHRPPSLVLARLTECPGQWRNKIGRIEKRTGEGARLIVWLPEWWKAGVNCHPSENRVQWAELRVAIRKQTLQHILARHQGSLPRRQNYQPWNRHIDK